MQNLITKLIFLGLSVFTSLSLLACATTPESNINGAVSNVPEDKYDEVISKFSRETKKYDGFHQTFGVNVTILNSEVNMLILQRRGHFLGWTEEEMRRQREDNFQEMSSYSKFFVSFFSPDSDYDDLHKPNTIWKIYLEFNGQRYEASVKKDEKKMAELKQLYAYIDRFRTPYILSFEVPMTAVEQSTSKLIFTSSLGTASFEFPPVSSIEAPL